jgi:hypothetical protein
MCTKPTCHVRQSWNKVSASECSWHYLFKFPCSDDNGVQVVKSTMFPTEAFIYTLGPPPDGNIHNQIDHILTDWHSGILHVHSFRGADCDTQVGTQHF